MIMPSKAKAMRPAKTSGIWKFAPAFDIKKPIPEFAATVSETTVPTKANVMATFNEPKK